MSPDADDGLAQLPASIQRFYGWLHVKLSAPRAHVGIIVASLLLLGLSLDTGLAADDYVHKLILGGSPTLQGFVRDPLDIFRFTTPETTRSLLQDGIVSWWAHPEGRLAFLRPVSSATHYLDHALWPDAPWLMHLHSIAWALLLYLGVLRLYQRLVGPGLLCSLALYVYVLDDARCWAASWVAGRNAVVATAISIWVLVLHMRGREGSTPARAAALLLLPVALLAGEGSLSICAYLFSYALWLDKGTLRNRVMSLVPYALMAVIWRVAYRSLGYGVSHSGLYFDPGTQTTEFIAAVFERAPILLYSQLGGPWSDIWSALFVFPLLAVAVFVGALVWIAIVGHRLWPIARREPVVAFACTGALLCLIPVCATFTSDRLLTWVAIGASLAIARLIVPQLQSPAARFSPVDGLVVITLVVTHILIGPPILASRARGNLALDDILSRADEGIPRDESISDKTVVFVNPPAVPLAAYIPIMRAARGEPRPDTQLWLTTGAVDVEVERTGPRTLRVAPERGFIHNPASMLLQDLKEPFTVGQTIALRSARIEVTEVNGPRPAAINAHFAADLEDPRYLWRRWEGAGYVPFDVPKVGERVTVPKVDYMQVVFGRRLPFAAVVTGND